MSNDITAAFKALSLHGMASAWPELLGTARMKALDHETVMHQLLKAESAQREVRSVAYQMRAARFPAHRDLAGFAFDQTRIDETLVRNLHQMKFVESAQNLVFVGGPGTGKTHLQRVWALRRSECTANACDSSPPLNWSIPWSWRKHRTKPARWHTA